MLDSKIYTFLKVVELGSYTAAATALHLTQPAVSQHIQKLEEHYGSKLFQLQGRAVHLTPEGRRFLHYAHMQQNNEAQLLGQLAGHQQPLRLGSTLSIADYYLPPLLAPLAATPETPLHLKVANTDVLLEHLVKGSLDAAFVEGNFDRSLFDTRMFCQAPFLPVAAANHPLARKTACLSQLYAYPLILREAGSGTRAILENHLAQRSDSISSFPHTWEVGSFMLIKRLLEAGEAISFMYQAVAAEEVAAGQLVYLDVEDCQLSHPLHFVHRKNCLEAARITALYSTLFG